MPATPRPGRDRWVVCADYVTGPYTQARAERAIDNLTRGRAAGERFACQLDHHIVTSATRPQPSNPPTEEG